METGLVLLLCALFCGLGAVAFPEGREKRKSDNVIVEVLPVVVYEVPPIPSVLAFDFEEAKKGKSKEKENKNKENKTKKVVKRGFKMDEKDDFKEDIKEDFKIELKGNKAKIEKKFEKKIHDKEEDKFKF